MIEGVLIRDLVKNMDERGFLAELIRKDWKETVLEDELVQLNLSYSYADIVRAWHRHLRGQVDCFICLDGTVKVCAYDDRKSSPTYQELDEIILSGERFMVARIPGFLWHGYKAISSSPIKLLYGVNKLYDYKNPDEERRPWNDPAVVPTSINGRRDDIRAGKPWDWFAAPHR